MELSLSSAKSFFVRKTVLQSLQGHFSFEKPFCKVCKVIFRLKNFFAKSAKSFFVRKNVSRSFYLSKGIKSVPYDRYAQKSRRMFFFPGTFMFFSVSSRGSGTHAGSSVAQKSCWSVYR